MNSVYDIEYEELPPDFVAILSRKETVIAAEAEQAIAILQEHVISQKAKKDYRIKVRSVERIRSGVIEQQPKGA